MKRSPPSYLRRVVVTGIGAITPLGSSFNASWNTLVNQHSKSHAITTLEDALTVQNLPSHIFDREISLMKLLPCQVAAPVRGVDHDPRTARSVQMVLQAGDEAMLHSGLSSWLDRTRTDGNDNITNTDICDVDNLRTRERIGTSVGCGMSSVREVIDAYDVVFKNESLRKLTPHFVPKVLQNSNAGRLSLKYGLRGPSLSSSAACAAGAHAIGDAMRCIQYGHADVMLAGGAESCIDPISMAGFCRIKALSTSFNHCPEIASRPFHSLRDGFVIAEGASILVLEEESHAKARGANILCELRGYGSSCDAYHITSPDPKGLGALRAMKMALKDSELQPEDVDYVNAHATSTPLGDEIEAKAIHDAFLGDRHAIGNRKNDLLVSSTKGATGHLLGAAGSLEAAFSVMTIRTGMVPPTLNLNAEIRSDCKDVHFHHVTDLINSDVETVVSNSFGFGGTNACLVFSKYDEQRRT